MSFSDEELRRIALAERVRATDMLPKVSGAGSVISRDGVDVQVMHNGVLIEKDCYYGAWMTELITRLRGHHEPQEEIAFSALVDILSRDSASPTMVELGSYWGYYSLWMRKTLPGASLILVEPDVRNLEIGRRNFELNDAEGTFIEAAIGPTHGRVIRMMSESDGRRRPVRTITLDGLVTTQGLDRVDLLLCDVQGAEVDMLRGAVHTIREGRLRFVVISTHWLQGRPLIHQTCLTLIAAEGGHVIADHSITESCSGDGLIVASFAPQDAGLVLDIPLVRARESLLGELEWQLARRTGWRGVAHGVADLIPRRLLTRARTSRFARRVFGRDALI
jgi:FkbM family methyltransferase